MKTVIVEIRGKYAAALTDDGCVRRIKNQNYSVGQTINLNSADIQTNMIKVLPIRKHFVRAASAAAVLVLCGVSSYAYYTPYSYVSLDVNPSIEYTLNRFDRVLSAKAVNTDGESLLMDVSLAKLKNKVIDEAIELTVAEIAQQGYFDGEPGGIVIAASAKNKNKASELADELQKTVSAETTENGDDVEVESISVAEERVAEAKELGVTPGRLHLVEKLQESAEDPEDIDVQEWLDKPVKEIIKATHDNLRDKKYKASKDAEDETAVAEDEANSDDVKSAKNGNSDDNGNSGEKSDKDKTDKDKKSDKKSSDNQSANGKNQGHRSDKTNNGNKSSENKQSDDDDSSREETDN